MQPVPKTYGFKAPPITRPSASQFHKYEAEQWGQLLLLVHEAIPCIHKHLTSLYKPGSIYHQYIVTPLISVPQMCPEQCKYKIWSKQLFQAYSTYHPSGCFTAT